jgi:lipoteichoic acid synthase
VFEYNSNIRSEGSPYSQDFIQNISYSDSQRCIGHTPKPHNIILLMVESLSSYQSKLFSDIGNWTPHLDAIARDNIYFKNFYANGFTTEDGQIALLTGLPPNYAPSSYSDGGRTFFRGYYGFSNSLPNILKGQGYTTEFLTNGNLEYSNIGEWAESIAFDYIEGHDHPYYDG